jgi:alcohol dehydrogenase class IV
MIKDFSWAVTPQLIFGSGKIAGLPTAVKRFGPRVLLVTGARSFLSSSPGQRLQDEFKSMKISFEVCRIEREPTPAIIDDAVKTFSGFAPESVIAIGGGSALDGGKAISAMLPLKAAVKDYLEGVGTKAHPGVKVPFIAVPTTAGTGSESTKNAVISETGEHGYKRSLRHDNFVPNLAIVDPSLALTCPQATTAASGMDAFTQLLESYVSTAASPVTDALAFKGLQCVSRSLKKAYDDGSDLEARTDMALAAYLSGLTLANAGLGIVHGLASPIGGFFEIPHGVICSALMAPANKVTVRKLRQGTERHPALKKYANVGKLFADEQQRSDDHYIDHLLYVIESLAVQFRIPRLMDCGIAKNHLARIVSVADSKNNPVKLDSDEMDEVLQLAL